MFKTGTSTLKTALLSGYEYYFPIMHWYNSRDVKLVNTGVTSDAN